MENIINKAINIGLETSALLAEIYANEKTDEINMYSSTSAKQLLLDLAKTIRSMKKEA